MRGTQGTFGTTTKETSTSHLSAARFAYFLRDVPVKPHANSIGQSWKPLQSTQFPTRIKTQKKFSETLHIYIIVTFLLKTIIWYWPNKFLRLTCLFKIQKNG